MANDTNTTNDTTAPVATRTTAPVATRTTAPKKAASRMEAILKGMAKIHTPKKDGKSGGTASVEVEGGTVSLSTGKGMILAPTDAGIIAAGKHGGSGTASFTTESGVKTKQPYVYKTGEDFRAAFNLAVANAD